MTSIFFIKDNLIASYIHMKEQQKRKIQQFHPEIEDGTDLRRWPLIITTVITNITIVTMYAIYLVLGNAST